MPNNGRKTPKTSSSPKVIREGVESAPSPTYKRPSRPGSGNKGSNNNKK